MATKLDTPFTTGITKASGLSSKSGAKGKPQPTKGGGSKMKGGK